MVQAPDSKPPPTDANPKTSAIPRPSPPPVLASAIPRPSPPPILASAIPRPSPPPVALRRVNSVKIRREKSENSRTEERRRSFLHHVSYSYTVTII